MTGALALLLAAAAPVATPVSAASQIEGPVSSQSVHEVVVPAATAAVWRAVSTPEGWRDWAARRVWTTAAEPDLFETSYDPAGAPGAPGNIKNRIVARVPQRLLAFRTVKAPDGFADFDALARVSWLIELEPAAGGTRVRLTGSGYPRTPGGERVLGFFMRGNSIALEALRTSFVTPAGAAGKGQQGRE